jgi:superfamily II DNA or RNA helicase
MADIIRRKAKQTAFLQAGAQRTLFQFTPESVTRLEEAGIVTPPPPPPPPERRVPLEIPLPGSFEAPARSEAGYTEVPPGIRQNWHLPLALRDYQEEALAGLLSRRKGSVYLPPGSGKTLIAEAATIRLAAPTIVIVPSLVLVTQWRKAYAEAGIDAGQYSGEAKQPGWVTLATYQSLYQNPEIIRRYPFIVFDEADLVSATDFSALLTEADFHPYVLAVTGTKPHSDERVEMLEARLPTLIRRTVREIGEAGHVIVPEIHGEPVNLTSSETEDYEKAEKALTIAARTLRELGYGEGPGAAAIALQRGTGDARQWAARYLSAYHKREEIVNFAANKAAAVVRLVKEHPASKVLLFGGRIEALDRACLTLNQAGIGCRVLSGETPAAARDAILGEWGKSYQVLASAKVLERGFNVPEVSVAIILSSGQSAQQILQRVGRIARPAPGKARADAYVVYARDTFEESIPKRMRAVIDKGV